MYNRGTIYWQFWPAELTFSVLIEEHNLPLQEAAFPADRLR